MRTLRGAALAAAAAALLAGCGGGGGGAPPAGPGFAAGPPIGQFTCADWNRAGPALRRSALERLRRFVGGPATGRGVRGRGAILGDDQARRLFHTRCAAPYAQGFLLVKLYTHAAAFAGR